MRDQKTNDDIRLLSEPSQFDRCARMMAVQDPWKRIGFSVDDCRGSFEGDWREVHGLFQEGELCGFAVIQPKGTFKGYIQTLCIDPGFQRRGLGSVLLEHCESVIRTYSPNVFICVSEFNTVARNLYRFHGYSEVGTLDNFLKPGFHELLLRKSFGSLIGNSIRSS